MWLSMPMASRTWPTHWSRMEVDDTLSRDWVSAPSQSLSSSLRLSSWNFTTPGTRAAKPSSWMTQAGSKVREWHRQNEVRDTGETKFVNGTGKNSVRDIGRTKFVTQTNTKFVKQAKLSSWHQGKQSLWHRQRSSRMTHATSIVNDTGNKVREWHRQQASWMTQATKFVTQAKTKFVKQAKLSSWHNENKVRDTGNEVRDEGYTVRETEKRKFVTQAKQSS